MIPKRDPNPFKPGLGGLPTPFLGRENEQNFLRTKLNTLEGKEPGGTHTVITAPRGNGKTALVTWLEEEIKEEYPGLEYKNLATETVTRTDILLKNLVNKKWYKEWMKNMELDTGLKISDWLTGGIKFSVKPREDLEEIRRDVLDILIEQYKQKPGLLIVDEAHTLRPQAAKKLLWIIQEIGKKAPFECILAGTPGLAPALKKADATFWTRCGKLTPGLIRTEEATRALEEPFENKVTWKSEAMDKVVQETQNYPYFIQLWGHETYRYAQEKELRQITIEDLEAIKQRVEGQKNHYYEDRYNELKNPMLEQAGLAIARAYQERGIIDIAEIERIIADNTPKERDITGSMDELMALGYIWKGNPDNLREIHPAIPSLMKFVLDYDKGRINVTNRARIE